MWTIGRTTQRQILKEGRIRTAAVALVIILSIMGCGKPHDKKKDSGANNEPTAVKKPEDIAVAMGPAKNIRTATVMDPKTKKEVRATVWEIEWQSANLAIVNGQQSGTMFKVKGTTYDEGKIASRFSGDRAEADKAANRLLIEGNVIVESLDSPKASMKAKKVEWLPDLKVFKASGDVLVEGEGAVVGPADQLYASPELKKIGTSKDYFKK